MRHANPASVVDAVRGAADAGARGVEPGLDRMVLPDPRQVVGRVDGGQPAVLQAPRSKRNWTSKGVLGERIC